MADSLITDTVQLEGLCRRLHDSAWIALDTEFMRVQTYRARLCLIQLATPELIACVDPLATLDITPLLELLYRPTIVKVLHAARQDVEVLADIRGTPLQPVFDTQIAAALVGHDDQIGYGGLVEAVTGHKLSKLEARTDWAARPLSAAQLSYAEDDVRYLRDVYLHLSARLQQLGRESWHAEECAALTDAKLYRNDPAQAWRRLGAGGGLPPAAQARLAALADWREREAQRRDLPRGWVVPDVALVDIVRRAPASMADLADVPELKPAVLRRDGARLLEIVTQAPTLPSAPLWETLERLDPTQTNLVKRLSTVVQERARAAQVSATLVAPRRELVKLVRRDPHCALLHGWRRGFIGEELAALCHLPGDLPGDLSNDLPGAA